MTDRFWGARAPLAFIRVKKTRQRPTLPPSCPGSTIGTGGLNFRVRKGNGCGPAVTVTGILIGVRWPVPRGTAPRTCGCFVLINFMVKPHGLLVLVS